MTCKIQRVFVTVLVVACCAALHGQTNEAVGLVSEAVSPPADRNSFHIYLLMGQSNMQGRDTRSLDSQVENSRVLALNEEGQWVVAKDPMFPPRGRTQPGQGPGIPFAIEMLKGSTNVAIGLVPCAVGGTSLGHWVKGGDLYERALKLAKEAEQSGVIEGVLWHQGESDTTSQRNAETYEARLSQMLKDLRKDLDKPNLPIVVGQIGEFLPVEKYPFAETVRAAIRKIPTDVPNVGYADSAGLSDRGDKLHFSAESQKRLGTRFARAMQALQIKPNFSMVTSPK
jgi:hypothetical protein